MNKYYMEKSTEKQTQPHSVALKGESHHSSKSKEGVRFKTHHFLMYFKFPIVCTTLSSDMGDKVTCGISDGPSQETKQDPSEWRPSFKADWGPTSEVLAFIVQKPKTIGAPLGSMWVHDTSQTYL
jgi:hypothetical protein